jgi:hypothetical protein
MGIRLYNKVPVSIKKLNRRYAKKQNSWSTSTWRGYCQQLVCNNICDQFCAFD